MRQLLISSPGVVELVEVPLPSPAPGELRVRSSVVGICGSDLHALTGEHPFITLPKVPGHEVVGVVEELGDGVSEPVPGTRVLLEPSLICGNCAYCNSGRYNICEHLDVVGCTTTGAMGDAFVAPASRFHVVPEAFSDPEAALVEPLSAAVRAVRLAENIEGRNAAILGAGSIGLLTLIAARCAGAAAVAVTEPRAPKRALALRLGADLVFDPASSDVVADIRREFGGRADVVFDCWASQSTMNQAIALAEKGGSVIVVGVPVHDVTIPLAIVQDREIRIEGSLMYVGDDVRQAIRLVGDGFVPAHEFVTATFPLTEGPQAFRLASSRDEVKVQIAIS
jgi:L-iditol 2-dehydrogenase